MIAGGFAYRDRLGEQGPVTDVVIKRTGGGRFTIDAAVLGLNGPVIVVPPNPGTDAFMTLKLGLAPEAGDRYCVQYGPESAITNTGAFFFKAEDPVEKGCPRPCGEVDGVCGGACPENLRCFAIGVGCFGEPEPCRCHGSTTTCPPSTSTSSTTSTTSSTTTTTTAAPVCGNGVVEPGEACDGGPFCAPNCFADVPNCCSGAGQCIDAPGFSLVVYLFQYCSVLPTSAPAPGDICQPDGSCSPEPIEPPISVCCQGSGSCYDATVSSTDELWSFHNVCQAGGFGFGLTSPAATCGPEGNCIPE
jgi:hypothetical protein